MECNDFMQLLDSYIEGTVSSEEAAAVKAHAEKCVACAGRMQMAKDLRGLDAAAEMPEGFSLAWRQAVREEKNMDKKGVAGLKKWAAVAAALVFVVGGTLMTRDNLDRPALENAVPMAVNASRTMTKEANYALGASLDYGVDMMAAGEAAVQEEKIIRTAHFTVKTTEFDQDLARVQALCAEFGGRVEYLYTGGDQAGGELCSASLRLRVPADRLDDFMAGAQGIGRMTSRWEEAEDVSADYYDVQARLDVQKQKMERLKTLLAAAENVADLIAIESSIADTQYMLDLYQGQLQNYDGRIDYSTVNVTVQEVKVEEEAGVPFAQRISAGLKNSLSTGWAFVRDAIVFLISASPWLAIAAGIIGLSVRAAGKRKKKK